MTDDIKYLERKDSGPAWIGRVRFSKSGRTIYYRGYTLVSLRGGGYKANYVDEEEGNEWWISGPKKDGSDTLYAGHVEVDEDARTDYWTKIHKRPDLVDQTSYRSAGKHG